MFTVNHTTIACAFNEATQILWPDGVKFHLLPVTNAQLYMKIQAEGLSVSYPKIICVMHVVNALHRVYETIHVLYINLEKLVANGKKILMKLPAR
jgi:Gpi18-like mannosyltransferase